MEGNVQHTAVHSPNVVFLSHAGLAVSLTTSLMGCSFCSRITTFVMYQSDKFFLAISFRK